MSSLVSGITKLFTSIGSSVGAGAATLGSGIRAVGASLFTGAAATGNAIGSGLQRLFGGGVLGNMATGAQRIIGGTGSIGPSLYGSAAADTLGATTATGFTGLGAAVPGVGSWTGAMNAATAAGPGPWGAAGALTTAPFAATGFAPTGVSGATSAAAAGTGAAGNAGGFLGALMNPTALAGALEGAGKAYEGWANRQSQEEQTKMALAQRESEEQRLVANYAVDPSAYVGGPAPGSKKSWQYKKLPNGEKAIVFDFA